MNFGFTEEQQLLRKTARDFLADHAPMKLVREALQGRATHSRELWHHCARLGWQGLALAESHGGAELSIVELAIVLEELGRALAPIPFLPTAIAAAAIAEIGGDAQQDEWLPRIAAGDAIATLAVSDAAGSEEPDGLALEALELRDGFRLSGSKLFVPDAEAADLLVTVARAPEGPCLFLVPRRTEGLSLSNMGSMDLLRPLYEVTFSDVRVPATALLGGGAAGGLDRVFDLARVMIAAEMVGGAEKCLEDSVAYAKQRVQFGKPIGVNQAIKHKCADMLFDVESAKSMTWYAAWTARERSEEAPLAAAMAKAYVGEAYRRAAAENIQIHGGVGFTWETDCHLYFKRARSDESWFGDSAYHRERVARMLNI